MVDVWLHGWVCSLSFFADDLNDRINSELDAQVDSCRYLSE